MTVGEHFYFYCQLFRYTPEEAAEKTSRLMADLELEEYRDNLIRELSGGNARKLAIALTFLGPAKILLLDEPTATLDPVARRRVHELMTAFKGEKTFMLCTHLLSEAESLCDMISIMVKGCVYTVGSPGYLSDKFGTEYKVDVGLVDASTDSAVACNEFFSRAVPSAVLSISRPCARIYTVPAADFTLPELFSVMQQGKEARAGFDYYTCSSSSLERVFMEIVRISQGGDSPEDGE
jgi:ABC-type multidrug transport system ATPase subunit